MKSAQAGQGGMAVVIPALNEEATIAQVVSASMPYGSPIVVDDGSADRTATFAREAGAHVISHPGNRGYDAALEAGLRYALDLGFEFAVTMDADGQHTPATLGIFAQKLANGADMVVGIRDKHQRFAESIFAMVGRWRWGVNDPLCGMKGYRLALLNTLPAQGSYQSIGTEVLVRVASAGCVIDQVPVPTRERVGRSRFGGGLRANWKILRALFFGLMTGPPMVKPEERAR